MANSGMIFAKREHYRLEISHMTNHYVIETKWENNWQLLLRILRLRNN